MIGFFFESSILCEDFQLIISADFHSQILVPCELFRYRSDTTVQEVVGTLESTLRSIKSHCKYGFGYKWMQQLDKLAHAVGGIFPEIIVPNVNGYISSAPSYKKGLCSQCKRDSDCGSRSVSNYYLMKILRWF